MYKVAILQLKPTTYKLVGWVFEWQLNQYHKRYIVNYFMVIFLQKEKVHGHRIKKIIILTKVNHFFLWKKMGIFVAKQRYCFIYNINTVLLVSKRIMAEVGFTEIRSENWGIRRNCCCVSCKKMGKNRNRRNLGKSEKEQLLLPTSTGVEKFPAYFWETKSWFKRLRRPHKIE